jgi:transcriptional regulator with XRE-family HTH domain
MPTHPSPFAERLRLHRTRRGWNQSDLGKRVGVSQATISEWELSKAAPTVPDLLSLCALLDVSADYLVGRSDYEQGLAPDTWLIDLDEVDQPTRGGLWCVKVPRRVRLVDYREMRRIEEEVRGRKGKKGTHGTP